jgi:hypothetical protein
MGHLKMKRIINTSTLETVWSGSDYLVDGRAGIIVAPLVLLDEVTATPPPHDSATQKLDQLPERADLENAQWIIGEMEAVDLTAAELSSAARATSRAALRQQWDALPAIYRGPYRPEFEAANRLLDEGDDEGAAAIIAYAAPKAGFTEAEVAAFGAIKSQMAAGIAALSNT